MTARERDTDGELDPVSEVLDFAALTERLRARQPVPPPPDPARVAAEREATRRRRMREAGVLDGDTIDLIAPAVRPPVVEGHAGNRAAWQAVYVFGERLDLRTLTLAGAVGTGKSWALAWLVADVDDALWLSPASVGGVARIGGQLVGRESLRARAMYAPLVVVEDLKATVADWQAAAIADLVEHRHNMRLRTALATNLDDATVRKTYGDAMHDRLHDAKRSLYEPRCVGASLRRRP